MNNSCAQTSPFVISHLFKAPSNRLFEVWTDPAHLVNWISPWGMNAVYKKTEFKVGGIYHYCLESPAGQMWGKLRFSDIKFPTRLEYVQSFSDEAEDVIAHPLAPNWPKYMLTTILFESAGVHREHTTVTLTWLPIEATELEIQTFEAHKSGMTEGWMGSFSHLEKYLAQLSEAEKNCGSCRR